MLEREIGGEEEYYGNDIKRMVHEYPFKHRFGYL